MSDRLDEIRGLLASVTPGRWWWRDNGNGLYLGSDEGVLRLVSTQREGGSDG